MDPTTATAATLIDAISSGETSAEQVVRAFLDRIERHNSRLNVFLATDPQRAIDQARAIDQRKSQGDRLGPLAGIPVAVKDVICIKGQPTTCGSLMLRDYRPPFDATVIARLKAADAILLGQANMDEFAMGSSTENSAYGPSRNPWDESRVPGGSSGGSAVAVAADFAPLALGSDTGGSIRQPASLCGIAGLKPTYGRVSRYGLIAYASSLDQIGPMAHDATDLSLLLNVISGRDPLDSTSVERPVPDYRASLESSDPPRIGVVEEFFDSDGLDPEVRSAVEEAIRVLEREGSVVKRVRLPHSRYGIPAYYLVATAECSSNLSRYDGTIFGHRASSIEPATPAEAALPPLIRMMMASRSEGFGDEVKRRIMLGTFALSTGYADQYYNRALKVRRLIRNDFDEALADVDVLVGPTSPTVAFPLGAKVDDPLAMYLSDIYTITANLAGIPGLSIPCGFNSEGLPIGLQLLGAPFSEEILLRTARRFERATDWTSTKPRLT